MNTTEPHRHGEATGRKAGIVIASTRAAAASPGRSVEGFEMKPGEGDGGEL